MKYLRRFESALERNERFGLPVPTLEYKSTHYLKSPRASDISRAIYLEFGAFSEEELVAQCFGIHYRLAPVVSKVLGVTAMLTIGYINFGGIDRFRRSEDELRMLMTTGIGDSTLGVHAWLTLPSMEIMDFALPTSMAVLNDLPEGRGATIAAHADELLHGLSYHPQLVGENYLFKVGAIRLAI